MSFEFYPCGSGSGSGSIPNSRTSFKRQGSDTTAGSGSTTTVISYTTAVGTTDCLSMLVLTTFRSGKWVLEVGGTEEASGRLAPGKPVDVFHFDPEFEVSANTLVEIKFTQLFGPNADVEAYLMGSTKT